MPVEKMGNSTCFGVLAVAGEEVFAGHAFLTGRTAGRDDVFGVFEGLGHVGGSRDLRVVETALTHFFCHTFGREYIVEANVGSETHHQGALHHVGADHAGGTDDHEFFVSQKSHFLWDLCK